MPRAVCIALVLMCVAGLSPVRAASGACHGTVSGHEGDCAPDFSLKTLGEKTLSLSDFKGKVVLLNFWASWCEPCAAEFPPLEQLGRALKGTPFVILSVSIDEDGRKAVEPFLKKILKNHLPSFAVLLDTNQKVSKSFGTFQVPETYIIDPSGRIVDKVIGIRDWEDPLLVHYLTLLTKEKKS